MTVIYQVHINHPIFGYNLIYTRNLEDANQIAQEWRDREATAEVDPIDEDVLDLLNYLVPLGTPVLPMTFSIATTRSLNSVQLSDNQVQ